jgi:hypothetical protein
MGNVNVKGGALEFDAVINMQQFQAQLNRMEASLQGITQTAREQSDAIEGFARSASVAIGSYLSLTAGSQFIGDIVRVRGEFQQLEVAFTTMLGSKEKSDKLMHQVAEFAATTPFELDQVAGATKQLLAFGISSDNVIDTLRELGDVSAGIGAPLGDIAYLFGTIKTQGVALTQDVRQFAQRGIPIYEELAKVLKVNVNQVGDFITAGKVGFPEIEQAFKNMTAEGSKFGGLMDAQSKTLTGQLSNLSDAWTKMLNEIGKSGEGVFADTISAASSLVEHYQDVLDILKVLAATYGTYKAAVLATTIATKFATAAANGYTVAETLRYQAMLISEKVSALLNKTLLKNPYVLVATGVAALVTALLVYGKTASDVKTKSELLADAQDKIGDKLSDAEAKIRPYIDALKNANLSEQERVNIYNQLKAIDPEIVKGIDAKTISYQNLAANVDNYLNSLRKQFALEANKDALEASIKNENKFVAEKQRLQKRIDELNKKQGEGENFDLGLEGEIIGLETKLRITNEDLESQMKVSKELGETQVKAESNTQEAKKRTLKVIDDEIAAEKKAQEELSTNSKEFQEHQKKINSLEDERKRIAGATKHEIAESNKLESETNTILNERKSILEQLAALQRDAKQSGLTKEQSELDKINEKYDNLIDKIVEFNRKTDEFNRKNNTNVQKFGLLDFAAVNDTRNKEIGNTALIKQGSEIFKNDLEAQKKIFEDFQQSVKDIGLEKAQEIFSEQTKGFTSFTSFLEAEAKKNINLINPGRMEAITKAMSEAQKKNEEDLFKERLENLKRLLTETASFSQKRLDYEKQYEKDVAELKKDFNGQELEDRLQVIKEAKDENLKALGQSLAAQTKGYRALHQNIVSFTKQRIQEEIEALEKLLQSSNLDKKTKDAIKAAIDEWKDLENSISDSNAELDEFIDKAGTIKGNLDTLASAVQPFSEELSNALGTMSNLVSGSIDLAKALKTFNENKGSGDLLKSLTSITGIVDAVFKVVSVIVNLAKQVTRKLKEATDQVHQFNAQLITGEIQYQELLRERERQLILNNKLTLDGLEAQKKELQQQKTANQQEFDQLFAQLQNEQFIKGKKIEINPFKLLFGKGSAAKDAFESLAGKTFDQIEELFNKGQLTDKAKAIFEQLLKLKQEGQDINAVLEENQQKLDEIFTGTTFSSIVDSISDGFKNGLHSAADFAGTFEDLMRQAMISSLKFQYLEPALKTFFDEFAKASESGNTLTASEIDNLKNLFNSSIADFDAKVQQFEQISGINLQSSTADTNSLKGAIKSMTEQTAELLAGQMGGLRITAIEQLSIAKRTLDVHLNIENNTASTVTEIKRMYQLMFDVTTGTKKWTI